MRHTSSLVFLGAYIFGVLEGATASQDLKDLSELQGNWRITKSITKGKDDENDSVHSRILIDKNAVRFLQKKGDAEEEVAMWTIRAIDKVKEPKWIDLQFDKVTLVSGVYKLENNVLTICLGKDARPMAFESEKGSNTRLIQLTRSPK